MRLALISAALIASTLSSCSSATPPPTRPTLVAILNETKFVPHGNYTGADTPDDLKPLQSAVDKAVQDISRMPDPLSARAVRNRLSVLLRDTDNFATEDRDEVGRYVIRIWRACGFKEETGLFGVSDDQALAPL